MIKGVNRQVIEINQTESEYFEKMLLFVKPEFAGMSEKKLREKAGGIILDGKAPAVPKRKKRTRLLRSAAGLTAAAGAGAAIMALAVHF